uniref:MFS domain-containing protein n=1 Tax=Rhabditophanes sp. KR3021 TaxID=114890 RepID=A0AC35TQ59_9BILA
MLEIDKKKKTLFILCVIFGIWHVGTQHTTTLISYLQWETTVPLTIVDLGYIQSFGALMNAVGALILGQLTDTTGPKTIFIFASICTCFYYCGLALCHTWLAFFLVQIFRIGYQLDSTAEMYLATITTEKERTGALMTLTIPQAIAMFIGPITASRIAVWTDLRTSQFSAGIAMFVTIIPVIYFALPSTHGIPKIASARLRPQVYWPMITRNPALREGLILRCVIVAAYICYELIARNFLLRQYMHGTNDSAIVLIVMGSALLAMQFCVLPFLQKRLSPKALLQVALGALLLCYIMVNFTSSLEQFLIITAVQTSAYAIAYAESCTQITSSVESTDLGKATGLASMTQWLTHFIVPIYTSHLVEHYQFHYAFYTSALAIAALMVYVSFFAKHYNARVRSLLPSLVIA